MMGNSNDQNGRRGRISAARAALAQKHRASPESVDRFQARMARLADVRRRSNPSAKRWCILRTSARSTVSLLETLERAGFDVWSPAEVQQKRTPRTRETVERVAAIMPSFVFAAEEQAVDLLRLSSSATREHASFSVFVYRDRIPLVSDASLSTLRKMEDDHHKRWLGYRRQADRGRVTPLPIGQTVDVPNQAFGGLSGTVVRSNGRKTLVSINGWEIEIETFKLIPDDVGMRQPMMGAAA